MKKRSSTICRPGKVTSLERGSWKHGGATKAVKLAIWNWRLRKANITGNGFLSAPYAILPKKRKYKPRPRFWPGSTGCWRTMATTLYSCVIPRQSFFTFHPQPGATLTGSRRKCWEKTSHCCCAAMTPKKFGMTGSRPFTRRKSITTRVFSSPTRTAT